MCVSTQLSKKKKEKKILQYFNRTSIKYNIIPNFKNSKSFELTSIYIRINSTTFWCTSSTLFKALCGWFWVIKTKKDKRKKKKEGILEGSLLFYFLLFCWFLIIVDLRTIFWFKIKRFSYFESSNGFKFLKFWIILLFGPYDQLGFVVIRVWI